MGKYFHIHGSALRPIDRLAALALAAVLLLLLAVLVGGCGEPVTIYQVQGSCVATTEKVLVLPFMDTRTFVDANDPHKDDLGEHARAIYVQAMRDNPVLRGADILTPALARQERSLTGAEIAELGRRHGADVVIAGQIFSFTDTRAASIPPRAGMFVRVVSARDGSILFVGDHYQSAAIPGASGGRDLQARHVADRLIEGLVRQGRPLTARARVAASHSALAMLEPSPEKAAYANTNDSDASGDSREREQDGDPVPAAPPFIGFGAGGRDAGRWEEQGPPELPQVIQYNDDFYRMPAAATVAVAKPAPAPAAPVAAPMPEPLPLPPPPIDPDDDDTDLPTLAQLPDDLDDEDAEDDADIENGDAEVGVDDAEAVNDLADAATSEPADEDVAEAPTPEEAVADAGSDAVAEELAENPAGAGEQPEALSNAALRSGDDLAADLFASEGEVWAEAVDRFARPAVASPAVAEETAPLAEALPEAAPEAGRILQSYEAYVFVEPETAASAASAEVVAGPLSVSETAGEFEYITETELAMASGLVDNGPIYSTPLAVEQPRTFRSVDLVELPDDPEAASEDAGARVALPSRAFTEAGAVRVLILPYHDRENPNNLIDNTGGGEVVTTLYGTQLAQDPGVLVMWDASGQATHDRLIDSAEAIQMGKMVGADYVIRGQVVEFRRAQSVPSFYSAVISTAVLAAQIFFAEFSGVDVATEVYRVSDGLCVMSRRDRAQQKYVVQSEKTVRKLAAGMAKGVLAAMKSPNPVEMDPLIDTLEPVTVFTNPR